MLTVNEIRQINYSQFLYHQYIKFNKNINLKI